MENSTPERDALTAWQRRLLPLMVRMLVALTAFFFIATLGELLYLNWRIQSTPPDQPALTSASPEDTLRLHVLAALEADIVARRYHQANVTLMAAIWSKYLGFLTGMTLALVGAAFVLGQLSTRDNELIGKAAVGEVTLRTASPGLVLAVAGVLLMVVTIVNRNEVMTYDNATYLGEGNLSVGGRPNLRALYPPSEDPERIPGEATKQGN